MKKKLTYKNLVHFPDGRDVPIEELTEEQREHMVEAGTIEFFKALGIIAKKKATK